LVLLLLVIAVVHGAQNADWPIAITVVLAVTGGPILLKYLNTRVVITPDYVLARNSVRWVSRCRRLDVDHVVTTRIEVLGPRFPLTRILLIDKRGRTCLSLQADAWSDDQLRQIYRALNVPVSALQQSVGPWEVNRLYPGTASLPLRFWPLTFLICFAAAFVLFGFVLEALHPG
jgi:hypothetical protein